MSSVDGPGKEKAWKAGTLRYHCGKDMRPEVGQGTSERARTQTVVMTTSIPKLLRLTL